MDASIMDGTNLDAGSVVCVPNVTNPIRVARAIMERVSEGGGSGGQFGWSTGGVNGGGQLLGHDRPRWTTNLKNNTSIINPCIAKTGMCCCCDIDHDLHSELENKWLPILLHDIW